MAWPVTSDYGEAATLPSENTPAPADYPSSYRQIILNDSPVGYWRLDEASGVTANDISGNGNNGTLTGGITLAQAGPIVTDGDTAIKDDGTGYVQVASSASLDSLGAGPGSIEAWVKLNSHHGNQRAWCFGVNQAWGLMDYLGHWQVLQNGNDLILDTGVATDLGAWHHLVVTQSGTTATFYLDGVQKWQATDVTPFSTNGLAFLIGTDGVAADDLDGWIDEVAVYNTALSAHQVAVHYQAASTVLSQTLQTQVFVKDVRGDTIRALLASELYYPDVTGWPQFARRAGPFTHAGLLARPVWTVQLDFQGSPAAVGTLVVGTGNVGTATGSWTPISGVQEIHINRGRQDELAKIEVGRATVLLDNSQGQFSPELTTSPFYPYVKPWRPIQIYVTFGGIRYYLFTGYVEDWLPVPGYEWQYVKLQCVDYFSSLQNKKFLASTTLTQQDSGARVGEVFTLASFLGSRDIDTGSATIAGGTPGSTMTLLQHIEDAEFIEQGLCWMGRDGTAVYRNANARYTRSESTQSQAVFGGPSGFGFETFEYDYSTRFIQNNVRITRSGGVEQTAEDTASQVLYGIRTLQQSSQWLVTDGEALSLAQLILSLRKVPPEKVTAIHLTIGGDNDPTADDMTIAAATLEISDRITVVREFPPFGLNRDFWIEGIQHDIVNGLNEWKLRYLLSGAVAQTFGLVGTMVVGTSTVGIGI